MNTLDQLGLRQKLISIGNEREINSFAWWLNREPLRSKPVGEGQGATAKELGIDVVLHDTKSLTALESITRAHSGEPNVLISRYEQLGEIALYGNGFYVTPTGNYSSFGFPIRFHNKKALKVIPNSLFFELDNIIRLAEGVGLVEFEASQDIILEKQMRRFNSAKIMAELESLILDTIHENEDSNFKRVRRILKAIYHPHVYPLVSNNVRSYVLKEFLRQIGKREKTIAASRLRLYIDLIEEIVNDTGSHDLIVNNQNHSCPVRSGA